MNKDIIIDLVFQSGNVTTKAAAERTVDAIFGSIVATLAKSEEVKIAGFGTFKVKKLAARKGTNPMTGTEIQIPARSKVKFVVGKALKEAVK